MKRAFSLFVGAAIILSSCSNADDPVTYTVDVTPSTQELFINDEVKLSVAISPEVESPEVLWISTDQSVATVSQDGTVKALAAGTTDIVANFKAEYGFVADTCVVSVYTIPQVSFSKESINLVLSTSEELEATVAPESTLTWKSSDESIVTVKDGTVTAVGIGQAQVTATTTTLGKDFSSSCTIVVEAPSVWVLPVSASVSAGDTVRFTATYSPGIDTSIEWSSSNENVAKVSSDGLVTGVAEGKAQVCASITVLGQTFSGNAEVTVTPAKKTYKIGDVIEFGGAKGIVFSVSENGENGKAVSLTRSGAVLWATRGFNTGAYSETDGKANTDKIIETGLSYHPAAQWCVEYGTDWYFPAIQEGEDFMNAMEKINPVIKANGGQEISKYDYYWSSTEVSEGSEGQEALYFYWSNNSSSSYSDFKNYPEGDTYVRAICSF